MNQSLTKNTKKKAKDELLLSFSLLLSMMHVDVCMNIVISHNENVFSRKRWMNESVFQLS